MGATFAGCQRGHGIHETLKIRRPFSTSSPPAGAHNSPGTQPALSEGASKPVRSKNSGDSNFRYKCRKADAASPWYPL